MTDPALCQVGDRCRGHTADGEPIPPRAVLDSGVICEVCRGRLSRWLDTLPTLVDMLDEALIPAGGHSAGNAYAPWPVNPAAVGLRQAVFGTLASWVLLVGEERGVTVPRLRSDARGGVRLLAAWLRRHVNWAAHREWAAELHREIRELWSQVMAATHPPDVRRIPVGRCPVDGCVGIVHAIIPKERRAAWSICCDSCDGEWLPSKFHELRRAIAGT